MSPSLDQTSAPMREYYPTRRDLQSRRHTAMNRITVENYRCFHEKQVARLAPLTLLVGDNSTGKTSFLALIRALWDCAVGYRNPNFNEPPFDLGSCSEIVHRRNGESSPASHFSAGMSVDHDLRVEVSFGCIRNRPVPVRVRWAEGNTWMEVCFDVQHRTRMQVGTHRGAWGAAVPNSVDGRPMPLFDAMRLMPVLAPEVFYADDLDGLSRFSPVGDSPPFSRPDAESIYHLGSKRFSPDEHFRPFVGAPVRANRRRTYDRAGVDHDPEGEFAPTLLADLAHDDPKAWAKLKEQLENFGSEAGLFDTIEVRHLGASNSDPFQLQIGRKKGAQNGELQNLIDVGFGVSQILPVLIELFQPDSSGIVLLQQPEVHIHPSAQAAFGTLCCQIASQGRQLVIETHSDNIMNRIRLDVRDQATDLVPEDVSILFFEQGEQDVTIHSLQVDSEGNILNTPDGYRAFFMEELSRSVTF